MRRDGFILRLLGYIVLFSVMFWAGDNALMSMAATGDVPGTWTRGFIFVLIFAACLCGAILYEGSFEDDY